MTSKAVDCSLTPLKVSIVDKTIIIVMGLLVITCGWLAMEIYTRPQFSDVSHLISLEAPINHEEKRDIKDILQNLTVDVKMGHEVRAKILQEIINANTAREKLLEVSSNNNKMFSKMSKEHAELKALINKLLEDKNNGPQ